MGKVEQVVVDGLVAIMARMLEHIALKQARARFAEWQVDGVYAQVDAAQLVKAGLDWSTADAYELAEAWARRAPRDTSGDTAADADFYLPAARTFLTFYLSAVVNASANGRLLFAFA